MLRSMSRNANSERSAKPYCQCWNSNTPTPWGGGCSCGENTDLNEWKWEIPPNDTGNSWVVVSADHRQVTFHPIYSSGTAAVRGDTPLLRDYHYYWEVKILSEPYGTDIMVGLGTDKVNVTDSLFSFISFLGRDAESYGLSYTGAMKHDNTTVTRESEGFCKGSIVGVLVDMWQGTLEFYLNRKSQGVSFYNLRRHNTLFPMICSTAAQSSMRLIYTASWQASLLVDAAKILAASVSGTKKLFLPPGLRSQLKCHSFWVTLPNKQCLFDEDMDCTESGADLKSIKSTSILSQLMPSQYMNGFYVDNVERDYRVVVWQ